MLSIFYYNKKKNIKANVNKGAERASVRFISFKMAKLY